ncbi:MAG: divalent-cation tolerance protein CutA [Verrucomicrobiales bacterium]|nr:divalent-cation tolerance protein CutA [Verrucomicrobiales bacterium]
METSEIRVVLSTFPDLEKARQIGTTLVESQLAACVNLIPQIESIYAWKGEIQRDSEVLALIKTTEAGFDALEKKLADLHPYDVPEIVALPVTAGGETYLKWVRETIEQG